MMTPADPGDDVDSLLSVRITDFGGHVPYFSSTLSILPIVLVGWPACPPRPLLGEAVVDRNVSTMAEGALA
jgi:hypothetical protein